MAVGCACISLRWFYYTVLVPCFSLPCVLADEDVFASACTDMQCNPDVFDDLVKYLWSKKL